MDREVDRAKTLYPKSTFVGVADGAEGNWKYLEKHTERQVLDFFHATEYLTKAAEGKFRKVSEREEWMENRCHDLKHKHGAASRIMNEMDDWMMEGTLSEGVTKAGCKVIIKQRLCASGMTKWKEEGSAAVINLRCLIHSTVRWQQFWDKIDQYGYSLVA